MISDVISEVGELVCRMFQQTLVVVTVAISSVLCREACFPPFRQLDTGCYLFSGSVIRNWWEAAEYCQSQNSYLVVIETEEENLLLQAEAKRVNGQSTWLGAHDMGHEGRWVWQSTAHDTFYAPWHPGEPNNGAQTGEENCMQFYLPFDYGWADNKCDYKFSFICEKDIEEVTPKMDPTIEVNCHCNSLCVTCPPRFVRLSTGCYFFSDFIVANWTDSSDFCLQVGGYLADIRDERELRSLQEYIANNFKAPAQPHWLGGSDMLEEGVWLWKITGEPIQVTFWNQGEPDDLNNLEDCLSVGPNGYGYSVGSFVWSDEVCTDHKQFICKAPLEHGPCPQESYPDDSSPKAYLGVMVST